MISHDEVANRNQVIAMTLEQTTHEYNQSVVTPENFEKMQSAITDSINALRASSVLIKNLGGMVDQYKERIEKAKKVIHNITEKF